MLESIQAKLQQDKGVDKIYCDGIASLIYMLESPLFRQLLNIEEALDQLKRIQSHCPVDENDFDLDIQSGKLLLRGALVNYDFSFKDDQPAEDFYDTINNLAEGRDVVNITLYKPEDGSLGFSVFGVQRDENNILGIYVEDVQPGSIAER